MEMPVIQKLTCGVDDKMLLHDQIYHYHSTYVEWPISYVIIYKIKINITLGTFRPAAMDILYPVNILQSMPLTVAYWIKDNWICVYKKRQIFNLLFTKYLMNST